MITPTNRNPQQKLPHPPRAAATKGFDSVMALINEPATRTHYDRICQEIALRLADFKSGFSPNAVLDGVRPILDFLAATLKDHAAIEEPSMELLSSTVTDLLQFSGFPIQCSTLEEQRKHDQAQRALLDSIASIAALPQRALRIEAIMVLRQIFSYIRQQCHDDINPSPEVVSYKKREYFKNISQDVVRRLLEAWPLALSDENIHVDAAVQLEDGTDSDDSADREEKSQAPVRHSGPQVVVLCKAIHEISHYSQLCAKLTKLGAIPLLMRTMEKCVPGERCLALCLEILWNLLALHKPAIAEVGRPECCAVLEKCLVGTLQLGYKVNERELRNDIIIVFTLLAEEPANMPSFEPLLPLLFNLFCGAELGANDARICKTYHYTTQPEELQMKKLGWFLIDKLCGHPPFAELLLDWGFITVLLGYIDVTCELPAVVRWSTLDLLDLQAQVLRALSSLAIIGAKHFSRDNGAVIVHEFISECPDISLRNLGVGVLARVATTHQRRELVEAGSIPLALQLLRDTRDNYLQIECLNLLADIVDRDPMLQKVFLQYDGVATVLPLLTISPDYYTDLLDGVVFAAVDCLWSCVFGSPENESSFLDIGGMRSLLILIEGCNPSIIGFPLSCLADVLQNPRAVECFRGWRSTKSDRSGTQLLLSFWETSPALVQSQQADGIDGIGLRVMGTSAEHSLRARPPSATAERPADDLIRRVGLNDIPSDVAPLVRANRLNFKIYVCLSLVGFDGHNELDSMERGTLATVERFIDLCKDEIWSLVNGSLSVSGITPIVSDREKLRMLRECAEERSKKLQATRQDYQKMHKSRLAEAEYTFYKSLIKKTEEKPAGEKKAAALSITQAKIRKAEMLKASYKQSQKSTTGEEPQGASEAEIIAQATAEAPKIEETPQEETCTGERADRWGPGQRAMTTAEYAVLQSLNMIRCNPLSLIPLIEKKLRYLNEEGNAFMVPNCDVEPTIEGAEAYREAIDFLKTVRPLVTLLDVPIGMLLAARDHATDLSRRMEVSQNGSDGSTPAMRLSRYGVSGTKYAQLLSLGHSDPMSVMMQLIVDDGVKTRVDRRNIFDPEVRVCGIAVSPHSIHETACVLLLSDEYQDKPLVEQHSIHAKFSVPKK